ncbi:MAG: SEC-C domain-containing protein [Phycisphaerae bacterium]|nr:SEC-C domain-containing protein [Phycisphaerae bacterium]
MREVFEQQYRACGVDALLAKYRGLALAPHAGLGVAIAGDIAFTAEPCGLEAITDAYAIRIEVPATFPRKLPRVWERGGRIPRTFHKLAENALCLGSMIRLRMMVGMAPTVIEFVDKCVVPYLYGYSYFEQHGRLPFGDLDHGNKGIIKDLKKLLGVGTDRQCMGMVLLASLQKRKANRQPCPCGSGKRLGKCHHRLLNDLRKRCGRLAFREEYRRLSR